MKLGRAVLCGPTTTLLLLFLSLSYLSCSAYGQVPAPAPAPISAEEGPLVEEETELDPFTGIQICLPYNVLVAPSTGNYSISIQSSLDVLAALNTTIADDTLQLQTDGDFVTDQPIKLTVFIPKGRLQSILVTSPLSVVTLAPGFQMQSLTINNGYNAAQTVLHGIDVRFLNVVSSGTGGVFVNGSIANANVQAASTGSVYLLGLNGTLLLSLADASRIIIHTTGENATLSGTTTGANQVIYDKAACNVLSPISAGSAGQVCQANSTLTIPAPLPLWSCGVEAFGNFSCAGGSSFVSTVGGHLTVGQDGVSTSTGNGHAAAAAGSGAVAGAPSTNAAAAAGGTPLAVTGSNGAVPFNPFSFVFGNASPFASSPEAAVPAAAPPPPAAASPTSSPPVPSSPFNPFQFVLGNSNPFASAPFAPGPDTGDASSSDGSDGAFAAAGSGRKLLQNQQVSTSTNGPGSMASGFTSVPGAPPISSSQQNGNGTTQTITEGPGTPPITVPAVPATLSTPPGASNQQVSTSTSGPGSAAFGSSSVPGAPPVTSSQTNGNGQTTTVTQTIPQTFQNSNGGNVIVAPGATSAAATTGVIPGVESTGARLDATMCALGADELTIVF